MDKKYTQLLPGVIFIVVAAGAIFWSFGSNHLVEKSQSGSTNIQSDVDIAASEKIILSYSQEKKVRLSEADGIFVPVVLPESVIGKTAALLQAVEKKRESQTYQYDSLEEYLLLFRSGMFTSTGAKESFDEKKICTLPVKDADVLMSVIDQFFFRDDGFSKNMRPAAQQLRIQLSYACGYLNVQTKAGTLESYLMTSLRNKTPLDQQKMQTLSSDSNSALYLAERGYILTSSLSENAKIVRERARQKLTLLGPRRLINEMNSSQWSSREYRMRTFLDQLVAQDEYGKGLVFATEATKYKDSQLVAIGNEATSLFQSLQIFQEANYDIYVKDALAINTQCDALSPSPLRVCIVNKMALAYLYTYRQKYDEALSLLKKAETYPLVDQSKIDQGVSIKNAQWFPMRTTKLALATAKVYGEMGKYEDALKYYGQEAKYRIFFQGSVDLRTILDKQAGLQPFAITTISK